jgi:hypothetical protein
MLGGCIMPSSGWKMKDLFAGMSLNERAYHAQLIASELEKAAKCAMQIEWLECFMGALEEGATLEQATVAGGDEWDF